MNPEQDSKLEKQMQEVIDKSQQMIKMKEDREGWKSYWLKDALKKPPSPEEAFEAGWRAAFTHRLEHVVDAHYSFMCPHCWQSFNTVIPVIVPEKGGD